MKYIIDELAKAQESINKAMNELAHFRPVEKEGEPSIEEVHKDLKNTLEKESDNPAEETLEKAREYTVRPTGASEVYLIRDGKACWIKNPETLSKLGFSFGDEKDISTDEFSKIPKGEPIDLFTTTVNVKTSVHTDDSSNKEDILGYRQTV